MVDFFKTQCLGNDFILLDSPSVSLSTRQIRYLCDRHFGIGADGILIIQHKKDVPEVLLFNADGSPAKKCFNGLRCVAGYLYQFKKKSSRLKIEMGGKAYDLNVHENEISLEIDLNDIEILDEKTLEVEHRKLMGYFVNVGNPHFVLPQEVNRYWLEKFGKQLSENPIFSNRVNVEFVWRNKEIYELLVYERGCGVTMACGTGAAAVVRVLQALDQIKAKDPFIFRMLGGLLQNKINKNNLIQTAKTSVVFEGTVHL